MQLFKSIFLWLTKRSSIGQRIVIIGILGIKTRKVFTHARQKHIELVSSWCISRLGNEQVEKYHAGVVDEFLYIASLNIQLLFLFSCQSNCLSHPKYSCHS